MIEKIITTSTRKSQGDLLKKTKIHFYFSKCEGECQDSQGVEEMKNALGG